MQRKWGRRPPPPPFPPRMVRVSWERGSGYEREVGRECFQDVRGQGRPRRGYRDVLVPVLEALPPHLPLAPKPDASFMQTSGGSPAGRLVPVRGRSPAGRLVPVRADRLQAGSYKAGDRPCYST